MQLDPLALARSLDAELTARQAGYRLHDDYYRGAHRLLFASEKFASAFGDRFSAFADNWCDLVVDACEERLNVEGFRLGADVEGDREAWRIWQANQLDADSQIAHTEALVHGVAYVMVAPPDPGRDVARITVESPAQVVVRHEPGDRRRRAAALKRWVGEDGHAWATLYLPDRVFKLRSERAHRSTKVELPKDPTEPGKRLAALVEQGLEIRGEWEFTDDDGGAGYANPLGVVPVVPLVNRPRLAGPGVSEIAHVIPIQDAVNKLVADMLVASEFAAFRQRWVTGIELPNDPVTGQPVLPFKAGADTMFGSENPETKFGEFGVSDLQTYVTGVEMLVQHVASQTRTPPHYFYLSGQFPSGESIKSAETGLVAKVRRKTRHFGEAWEEVIALALRATGSPQAAAAAAAETIWGDPESRSESEHMDAVSKKAALGVPWQQLMEDSGYSPAQIERMRGMRRQEALDGQGLDLTLLREATDAVDTAGVPAGGGVPPPAAGGPY